MKSLSWIQEPAAVAPEATAQPAPAATEPTEPKVAEAPQPETPEPAKTEAVTPAPAAEGDPNPNMHTQNHNGINIQRAYSIDCIFFCMCTLLFTCILELDFWGKC